MKKSTANKQSRPNRTRIIAVVNQKGGVGKTTTVLNVGAGLAQLGKKVLLIDMDPQANLSENLGLLDADKSIYDVIKEYNPISPFDAITSINENLDIIPSNIDLAAAEVELRNAIGGEFLLKEALKEVVPKYDYIIIDCPPSLGITVYNALTFCEEVYVPVQLEFYAMRGMNALYSAIANTKKRLNPNLSFSGVIATFLGNRRINKEALETLKSQFHDQLFKTVIRDTTTIKEAAANQMDVHSYKGGNSIGSQDYMEICKEILRRHGDEQTSA